MAFLKVESNYFPRDYSLNVGGKLFTIERPQVMGILNSTPDSFYAESRFSLINNNLSKAEKMLQAGASMLDIGGYSSRPGAANVSLSEELSRVIPIIEALSKAFPNAILSIDTFRSAVALAAYEAGARIINDISGGELDAQMFQTIGQLGCPYILMHMKGTPQTMQNVTDYDQLFLEMMHYFTQRITILRSIGVKDIVIDPGFGFAKTVEQNFELLKRLSDFQVLNCPILVGVSRKSMIYKTLETSAEESLNGTTALHIVALQQGATLLRVHDVKEAMETIQLFEMMK